MQIEINKEVIKAINKAGISEKGYLLLLSIQENEEIFDENDLKIYLEAGKLIVLGLLQEDFSDSEQLFLLTEKAENLIKTIQNQ